MGKNLNVPPLPKGIRKRGRISRWGNFYRKSLQGLTFEDFVQLREEQEEDRYRRRTQNASFEPLIEGLRDPKVGWDIASQIETEEEEENPLSVQEDRQSLFAFHFSRMVEETAGEINEKTRDLKRLSVTNSVLLGTDRKRRRTAPGIARKVYWALLREGFTLSAPYPSWAKRYMALYGEPMDKNRYSIGKDKK